MSTRIFRLLIVGLIILTTPYLGGCGKRYAKQSLRPDGLSTRYSDHLPIRGEVVDGSKPVAIDIENLNGSVTVKVDDKYDKAFVYARAQWRGKYSKAEWESLRNEEWVVAEHVIEDGNSILRVLSQASPETDPPAWVQITVLMPSCDGVFIRNAGGPVLVVGSGGAHTIESGFDRGSGGHVEVRTGRKIVDPISLRTSDGNVDLILAPNSGGTVDLQTDRGRAIFGSAFGRTTSVRAESKRWSGVWNAQSNPISLQTLRGTAVLRVTKNPEMHSTGQRLR
ncbi:MAG: hypothetical protein KIT88_08455 [Phycisphaeraceae bacterium]|nr:hypothetical protein [Phycisphaeraceae bacterium]